MESNDRREIHGDTFRIESEQPARPLTAQRWFRTAVVLLVLAGIAGVVVYTQGDTFMASWYASRAEAKANQGNYQGAIEDISHAIKQTPDNIELYRRRGQYRMQAQPPDLDGAISDFDHVLEHDDGYAMGYMLRSMAYQRMAFLLNDADRAAELHAQAIADLEEAQPHMPKNDPLLLNQLAYSRALAGSDLKQALAEIDTALANVDAELLLESVEEEPVGVDSLNRAREIRSYLDTRGFIHHLLGDQVAALKDMDLSIDLHLATNRAVLNRLADEDRRTAFTEEENKIYSVLLHHRGLVHQALGNEEQAQTDLQQAEDLGYDPKSGVF